MDVQNGTLVPLKDLYLYLPCGARNKVPREGSDILQTYNNMKSILRDGKTGKSVAGTNRFFPILPITIVLGLGVMVAWMSPSHVYENNPCLYLLTFGITTARITNTLLVCVLTKDELPMVDSGIIAPLLLLVNQYFHCPIDETLLLKISLFKKYWRWLIEQVPTTWAPNSMTLVGLIINISTMSLLIAVSSDGKTEVPRFIYLLCAVGLFVYQSLDAIDGKQARRTKTNTPLGELFDHGCDSVSTAFVGVGVCTGILMGENLNWMMFEVFSGMFLFYQAHWQAYVTGTLRFSQFDVTESQLLIISIFLINFLIGPSFWSYQIPVFNISLRIFMVLFSLGPAALQVFNNMTIILEGGKGKNKSTIAGTSTIFPVFPIAIVLGLGVIIANKSPSNMYENNPCLYLLTFGIVAARVTNRLVVAHMTKSELDLMDSGLWGPFILIINQYFNCILNETMLLWFCFIYVIQDILRYSSSVCQEICDYLEIYCFDIVSKRPQKQSSRNGKSSKS
ncbi:hypothetical protein FSP39_004372 [Pinctada imbricata]|uniref:diacylglycerol cholinephosphotransferase n=1 Tax=Pinctada imbricata TaxID=66713 RepID=A0AA88YH09_PINIB|nr:hypothetical protein FSP39_004372 [Pinctada imbricata]